VTRSVRRSTCRGPSSMHVLLAELPTDRSGNQYASGRRCGKLGGAGVRL
jgi:hypothetical protein